MPANIVKSFAKDTGKSVPEVEKMWDKAKAMAADEGQEDNYAYITGILKKMLGIKESAIKNLKEAIQRFHEVDLRQRLGSEYYAPPEIGGCLSARKTEDMDHFSCYAFGGGTINAGNDRVNIEVGSTCPYAATADKEADWERAALQCNHYKGRIQ